MSNFVLAFGLLMPLLLGIPALRLLGLRPAHDRVGFAAWSWLLGCFGLGVALQLCRETGLPVGWWWTVPLTLALGLGLLRRGSADSLAPPPAAVGRWFAVFVAVGAGVVLWFALAGLDRPCIEGDEGNIWSLKAKSLLVDWGETFAAAQVHNLHPDYPQLNPWLQAWIYSLTGVPDFVHFENRWLVQLCDVALFVAVAAALRHRTGSVVAGVGSALVLLEPEFQSLCRTAYADGMVALGLVVAVDGWLRWRDGGPRGYAWLAGIGLAFALWSKNETMLYLASAGIAALLLRIRSARGGGVARFLPLLPALLVIVNTALWNRRFGMQSDLLGANPTGKSMFALMAEQWPERVPALFAEAWRSTLALDHIHAVLVLVPLAVVLVPRVALGRDLALPVLALLGSVVGLHVVYVGSFLPLRMHLDTSYLRVVFQLLPAALVLIAACWRSIAAERRLGQTAAA